MLLLCVLAVEQRPWQLRTQNHLQHRDGDLMKQVMRKKRVLFLRDLLGQLHMQLRQWEGLGEVDSWSDDRRLVLAIFGENWSLKIIDPKDRNCSTSIEAKSLEWLLFPKWMPDVRDTYRRESMEDADFSHFHPRNLRWFDVRLKL